MDCIFCEIVAGEVGARVVWDNDDFVAVLDKFPTITGQVLILSREHEPQGFSEMSEKLAAGFVGAAKAVAEKMKRGLGCSEVTFMIEGLDVKHAHAKIFPVFSRDEYVRDIVKPGRETDEAELEVIQLKIRKGA